MILRRLTEHVRTQNWFAVGIDFVIVVVGVFLGIQIGNWNEARVSHFQEAKYLEQLRNEIIANTDMARRQAQFVDRIVEGGRNGLQFLDSDEPCTSGCERLMIDLFHASQVWGTNFFTEKYKETNRRGIPTHEPLRLVIQEVYSVIDGWDTVNATPPPFRERVRGYIPVDASVALWKDCYKIEEMVNEIPTFGCLETLSEIDLTAALTNMQADPELAISLRYWVGQNEYARLTYPELIERAEASVDAINLYLEEDR